MEVAIRPQKVTEVTNTISGAGGEITSIRDDNALLLGWLPIQALESMSIQNDIYYIRKLDEFIAFENPQATNTTTEGLYAIIQDLGTMLDIQDLV